MSPISERPVAPGAERLDLSGATWLERWSWLLIGFDLLLGAAHLTWPDYRWGQGHDSYFHLDNSLTLASWLASMQLVGAAIFAALAYRRERSELQRAAWPWLLGACGAIVLSVAEMTRFPERFKLVQFPEPDPYRFWLWFGPALAALTAFGAVALARLRGSHPSRGYARAWLIAWGAVLALKGAFNFCYPQSHGGRLWLALAIGLAYLLGLTFLLVALAGYALRPRRAVAVAAIRAAAGSLPRTNAGPALLWGVFGTTLTILLLQSLLLRVLNIFGDYLTAHSVISIALLGISIGGLAGYQAATRAPLAALLAASLLLPIAILATYAAVIRLGADSLATASVLAVPFVLGSTAVTVALALGRSHRIYGADLLGAAAGALLVGPCLSTLREEGSLLLLAGFAFLAAFGFVWADPAAARRATLSAVCFAGIGLSAWLGIENLRHDWLNIVRELVGPRYPRGELLFSRSSLVGRYDILRRSPRYLSLSALENGRITDTIRRSPSRSYQIDPRLPSDLIEDPAILILGLSGDAITKTAKHIATRIDGVEINPAVVDLQTHELVPYNGSSYRGIEVSIVDGRSYVAQTRRRYDIITLLNAHLARGGSSGRLPSPEYLHTREAIGTYLDLLTDRGIVDVEELLGTPREELPIWKLLWTMRQALLERGIARPGRHFFIFQWHTAQNNYLQILMKKTPFSAAELERLRDWLKRCDQRFDFERKALEMLGPITAKTTLLHAPDQPTGSNCSRLVRGLVTEEFLRAHGLTPTSDDRPFHFDVDPSQAELRRAYRKTLILCLLLVPFVLALWVRSRAVLHFRLGQLLVVVLTGMAYFLIEVVLLQRFAIFLGSPLVTFTAVLATLLAFSGLGSLWSGRLGDRGAAIATALLPVLLLIHAWLMPSLLAQGVRLPLAAKALVTMACLAPLALLMGVPFPYVMRMGQTGSGGASAALLFAINGAASALAVPLAFNLSGAWGFGAVLWLSLALYLTVALLLAARRRARLVGPANALALALVIALLAAPWRDRWGGTAQAQPAARYRIDGIRYGRSRVTEDKVFADGSRGRKRDFAWLLWLVRGNGRTVLVDTGFEDPLRAQAWHISDFVRPTRKLRELGIAPEQVTDVILTHAHWDHMGGIAAYPRARIYVQDQEVRYAELAASPDRSGRGAVRWEDLLALRRAADQGRVERIDGNRELSAGLTMVAGGAHTPGSQYVLVETLDGTVVLAGDAVCQHDNNVWQRPIGSSLDPAANLAAIRRMQQAAASPFLILPGHEPAVMGWFPPVADGVVEVSLVTHR